MTIKPNKHEIEDFIKTMAFQSGQFAIVDAEVLKAIKDKVPLADKAIFVPTKQAQGAASPFKIVAEYDDATLRRLVIEPAPADTCSEEHPESEKPKEQVEEGIQLQGHEGDPVQKKISKIGRKGGGAVPKTGDRSYRNAGDSATGNPKTKLTKGRSPIKARISEITSVKGARRGNYGQPRSKIEQECLDLLIKTKEGTITEEFINSLDNIHTIRQALVNIRDHSPVDCSSNSYAAGKKFDLIYESISMIDKYTNHKEATEWVQDLIDNGVIDV